MDWQKDFIEWVKKNQLVLRSLKSSQASNLYQAPVALHSEEIHFVREIIEKLDGHTYGKDVCPFLELKLTKEDVAEVGASATLLVLNNDVGLTTVAITALCNFASSSTTGTWLKSAIEVCETPIIISKGFRIRFREETCKETGVGCIVPEWAVSPTDDKVLSTIGREELPANVIILPICNGKVDLIRNQLTELCPEVLLFLSSIRALQVVDETESTVDSGSLGLCVTRSHPLCAVEGRDWKFSKVTLTVECSPETVTGNFSYFIFERRFPVMPSVQERKEIHCWVITLAFPPKPRAPCSGNSDVFSVLQTRMKTGFPFLINADFVFTSSKEIQVDNAWNAGILSCIPMAFQIAFEIMLGKPESELLQAEGVTQAWIDGSLDQFYRFSAYQYLPCNQVEEACSSFFNVDVDKSQRTRRKLHHVPYAHHLEMVRCEILQLLDSRILLSSSMVGSPSEYTSPYLESNWFSAKDCLQVNHTFRHILLRAFSSDHPAPGVVLELPHGARRPTATFVIVDFFMQNSYASVLSAVGVPEMTKAQYETFLMDSQWLVNLPDDIYVRLLYFFAFEMNLLDESESRYSTVRDTFSILKVRGQKCPVELATFSEVGLGAELQYISCADDAQWILEWVNEFRLWDSAKFMPAETWKAFVEANDGAKLVAWVKKHGSLTDVNAENYAERLIAKLEYITDKSEHQTCNPIDAESTRFFSILVMQFLYSGICEKRLSWEATVDKIQSLGQVFIVDHKSSVQLSASQNLREGGGVLLPPKVSRWSRLFPIPLGCENRLIVLSDKYLDPHCPLVKDIVTSSRGSDTMFEFLKQSFNANDVG